MYLLSIYVLCCSKQNSSHSIHRNIPGIDTCCMSRPPKSRSINVGDRLVGGGGRLEPPPVTVDGLEISHLGANTSAAVSMDSGDCPKVFAILAKPTEVEGVKGPYFKTQLPKNALQHKV